jgi:hypothetical protein
LIVMRHHTPYVAVRAYFAPIVIWVLPVSQLVLGALRALRDAVATTAVPEAFVTLDSDGSAQTSPLAAGVSAVASLREDFRTQVVVEPLLTRIHAP